MNKVLLYNSGGQTVFPGTKVNVKWLDTWYEGEVLELGPQSGLYKVI